MLTPSGTQLAFAAGACAVIAGVCALLQRGFVPNPVRMTYGASRTPPFAGGPPPSVKRAIERYQNLERKIEQAYLQGKSPLALEEKAAELLDVIESQVDALQEEGERFPTRALDDPINARFSAAYEAVKADPIEWAELQEFLYTGEGKIIPARTGLKMTRGGGYEDVQLDEYVQYPGIVNRLRYSEIGGLEDADPIDLIEAAEDAYEDRQRLLRRIASSSGPDPVRQARRWARKHRR